MPIVCTRCGASNHGNKNGSPCVFCGSIIYGNKKVWSAKAMECKPPKDGRADFNTYFRHTEEFPKIGMDILPMGTDYVYVSCTFLNGFINYVKPLKAFVLGRYHGWDEELDSPNEIHIQDPPGSRQWVKPSLKTKDEFFKALTVPGAVAHSKLDTDFQDDVLILAKSEENHKGEWCYFYFWYDRDSSDCCIGRFQTTDDEEVVVSKFYNYCNDPETSEYGSREIPLHYFQGWISG